MILTSVEELRKHNFLLENTVVGHKVFLASAANAGIIVPKVKKKWYLDYFVRVLIREDNIHVHIEESKRLVYVTITGFNSGFALIGIATGLKGKSYGNLFRDCLRNYFYHRARCLRTV